MWLSSGKQRNSTREIHPLDPQPHRHSMLVPRVCAPRVTRCSLGSIGHVIGFAAISVWPRACETSRQPILGYTGYLWLIVVRGSEIWWCKHSAHSLSTTLRLNERQFIKFCKSMLLSELIMFDNIDKDFLKSDTRRSKAYTYIRLHEPRRK